jgi:WD40 repeat protein
MARRSAELAVVRGPIGEAQSATSPTEAAIRALESEITSNRDQPTPAFLKHVMERICSLTQADGVALAACDQWGVVCRASTGNAPEVGSRLRADSALTRECLETGQVVICEDTQKDYRVDSSIARSLRLRSAVAIPLRTRDSVLGVLEVFSSRALAFDPNQVAGLQRFAEVLAPALAPGLSEEPAQSVLLSLPDLPEQPKSKVRASLIAGAALLSLISLLFFAVLHRQHMKAPSAPALPSASSPVRSSQPTVGQQDFQVEATEETPVKSHGLSHRDLPAPTASSPSSSPSLEQSGGSRGAQPERTSTTENRTSVPALVILDAPPGAQIFVDDELVASTNSDGQARISTLALGQHRLRLRLNGYLDYDQGIQVQEEQTSTVTAKLEAFELPASNALQRAPIFAGMAAIPAPVTSTRTPPPDFVPDRSFKGHSGWVTTVAFSSDGQRLASGSWDQTVKFWEVSTGEPLGIVISKMKEIQALAFSRDGRWLAVENSSNTVTLRDTATGQEVRALASDKPLGPLGSNWVYSIAFSPDGQSLATGLDDKTVRLWDVNSGRRVRDFATLRRRVIYIAFSPDGRLLASGDDDKTIRIWNVASGQELQKLSGHRKPVYAVGFSPNGRLLASASGDKTVRLWDVASGREVHRLTGHGNVVTSLAFSPDGLWLVSGSWDKTIKIWEVETGREVQTLVGHDHPIYSVAFDSRGRWLAAGSEDGTIELWRLADAADQNRKR